MPSSAPNCGELQQPDMDIIFMIDTSGNSQRLFANYTAFVSDFVTNRIPTLSPTTTRVAYVLYAGEVDELPGMFSTVRCVFVLYVFVFGTRISSSGGVEPTYRNVMCNL
jgi:hypothetical protein